jgi:hypothetical protein
MNALRNWLRTRWADILVTGIFLQSIIAAIYTFDPHIVIVTALGGLAMLILVFGTVSYWRRCHRRPTRGENVAFKMPRGGLLFTVGFQADTINLALDHQKPAFVAFLCSPQTEKVVDALVLARGYDAERYKKEIADPQNVKEIRTKTGLALDWLEAKGLKSAEIAADITGGMTTMSVAVFSVTEERRVDSQYVRSAFDDQNRRISGSEEAVLVSRYS